MEPLAAATLNPTLIPALFAGRGRNSALDLWVNPNHRKGWGFLAAHFNSCACSSVG
jgi:hypothetical protein